MSRSARVVGGPRPADRWSAWSAPPAWSCAAPGRAAPSWRVTESLTAEVVDRVVAQPVPWHRRQRTGDLITRAGVDAEAATARARPAAVRHQRGGDARAVGRLAAGHRPLARARRRGRLPAAHRAQRRLPATGRPVLRRGPGRARQAQRGRARELRRGHGGEVVRRRAPRDRAPGGDRRRGCARPGSARSGCAARSRRCSTASPPSSTSSCWSPARTACAAAT